MTPPTSPLTEGPKEFSVEEVEPGRAWRCIGPGYVGQPKMRHEAFEEVGLIDFGFSAGVAHDTATQSARVEEISTKLKAMLALDKLGLSLASDQKQKQYLRGRVAAITDAIAALPTPTEPGKDK